SVTRSDMNGVCRCAPSRNIPACHSKSGLDSRKTPSSSAIGSVRQARPRLKGPSPIPTKSWTVPVVASASGSAVKGLSQVLLGVAGDQVEDGSDVGRRGLGVQKGELQVVPPGDLGARDDGVPGGEQRFAGVEVGPVDLGRVGDGGRDVAEDEGG